MDLSVRDLLFNPESARSSLLRPSAQSAGDVASLAAFNDLLNHLGQTKERADDRSRAASSMSPMLEVGEPRRSAAPRPNTDHKLGTDDRDADTAGRSQADTKDATAAVDGAADADSDDDASPPPLPQPARQEGTDENGSGAPQARTDGLETAAAVSFSNGIADSNANAVAETAVAMAQAMPGGKPDAVPGQAVSAAVATAVAEVKGGAVASPSSGAPKVVNGETIHTPLGGGDAPDISPTPHARTSNAGLANAGTEVTATKQSGATGGASYGTAGAHARSSATANLLASLGPAASIEVEATPPVWSSRSALAHGILVAQEVADSHAASSLSQAATQIEAQGLNKPNGSPATPGPQSLAIIGGEQAFAGAAPSPANTTALEALKGQGNSSTFQPVSLGSSSGGITPGSASATQLGHGATTASTGFVRGSQPVPLPVDQFAVHIARAAASGAEHINIKLKPAALGHVEVKLDVTHDGRIAAVVTAERSDTLDLLQRDSRALERALQEAGLKTDSNSLQFNLRGENGTRHDLEGKGLAEDVMGPTDSPSEIEDQLPLIAGAYENSRASEGGVDISV